MFGRESADFNSGSGTLKQIPNCGSRRYSVSWRAPKVFCRTRRRLVICKQPLRRRNSPVAKSVFVRTSIKLARASIFTISNRPSGQDVRDHVACTPAVTRLAATRDGLGVRAQSGPVGCGYEHRSWRTTAGEPLSRRLPRCAALLRPPCWRALAQQRPLH